MNRRQMLRNSVGLIALAGCSRAFPGDTSVAYTRELYDEALASGEAFMLDFSATW